MRRIQKTVFKVGDFLSWQRSGSLTLSPAFQRRPVWSRLAKSFLIDTILKDLPIPIIFLRERTNADTLEPIREVVDGQQRLRTVFAYVDPKLLIDFNEDRDAFTIEALHNGQFAGLTFQQLPAPSRQQFLDYEFSVHVLSADTEDREVLQIFGRMNSTGLKLNDQELRNAEFFGAFKTLMYQLAYEQLDRWRAWRIFSETDIARMLEVEETSDLVITIFEGLHGKTQEHITQYYREHNGDSLAEANELTRRFRLVMDQIAHDLGSDIAKTQFRRRPLFNTLFTFYYQHSFGLKSPLRRTAPRHDTALPAAVRKASADIGAENVPEELRKVLRGSTGNERARKLRLDFLNAKLRRAARH